MKLSHTQWEVFIERRGPYDACKGVQLVLTALLGQIYGALSKVRNLYRSCGPFPERIFLEQRNSHR